MYSDAHQDFRIRHMTFVSFNNNNTNRVIRGAGNANPSGAHELSPDFCFTSIATMLSIPEHLRFLTGFMFINL